MHRSCTKLLQTLIYLFCRFLSRYGSENYMSFLKYVQVRTGTYCLVQMWNSHTVLYCHVLVCTSTYQYVHHVSWERQIPVANSLLIYLIPLLLARPSGQTGPPAAHYGSPTKVKARQGRAAPTGPQAPGRARGRPRARRPPPRRELNPVRSGPHARTQPPG